MNAHNHALDVDNILTARIHPDVEKKFRELCQTTMSWTIARRSLERWVEEIFVPSQNQTVDFLDFRVYPRPEKLRAVFASEIKKRREAETDQLSIHDFIQENKNNPNIFQKNSCVFEPYEKKPSIKVPKTAEEFFEENFLTSMDFNDFPKSIQNHILSYPEPKVGEDEPSPLDVDLWLENLAAKICKWNKNRKRPFPMPGFFCATFT